MGSRTFSALGWVGLFAAMAAPCAAQEGGAGALGAVPPSQLLAMLGTSPPPQAREAIMDALLEKRLDALPVLRRAAVDGTPGQRLVSLSLLAEMRDAQAVDLALACLDASDVTIERRAAHVLMVLKPPRAYGPLVTFLGRTPDLGAAKSAIAALGAIGNESARPLLRAYLAHEDASVRANAAISLAALGSEEGFETLVAALASADLQAQREATFGLGYFTDPRARALAERFIADPTALWKGEAHVALAQGELRAAGPDRRVVTLVRLLNHEHRSVRHWAVDQLASTDSAPARQALEQAARASTAEGRHAARKVLAAGPQRRVDSRESHERE